MASSRRSPLSRWSYLRRATSSVVVVVVAGRELNSARRRRLRCHQAENRVVRCVGDCSHSPLDYLEGHAAAVSGRHRAEREDIGTIYCAFIGRVAIRRE